MKLRIPVLFAAICLSAHASIIYSGDTTATISNGAITIIAPPEYNPPFVYSMLPSPAVWVSYGNTGVGGQDSGIPVSVNPLFTIFESLSLSSLSSLSIEVLGDDDAALTINGVTQVAAVPGNEFTTPAVFSLSLAPGSYIFGFEVFNYSSLTSGNYTGVDYFGVVTPTSSSTDPAPEPGTGMLILGGGLLVVGFWWRQKRHNSRSTV